MEAPRELTLTSCGGVQLIESSFPRLSDDKTYAFSSSVAHASFGMSFKTGKAPPPAPGNRSSARASSRFPAAGNKNSKQHQMPANNQDEPGGVMVTPRCVSGAPSGLCSCRVVLRTGVVLPLSLPEPDDDYNTETNSGTADNNNGATRTSRWLVLVKAEGGELSLSLLQPSRAVSASSCRQREQTAAATTTTTSTTHGLGGPGMNTAMAPGLTEVGGRFSTGRGIRNEHSTPIRMLRSRLSLSATCGDWDNLGYGPLQWMSHAQKAFIARLSLYWVSFKPMPPLIETGDLLEKYPRNTKKTRFCLPGEAFPRFRPILSSATRVVGTPSEMMATTVSGSSSSGNGGGGSGGDSTRLSKSADGTNRTGTSRLTRVFVRDEGGVFRVEVEVNRDDTETGRSRCGSRRLECKFGKEAWRNTGLGELLWLDGSNRKYLALRLAQQVCTSTNTTFYGR